MARRTRANDVATGSTIGAGNGQGPSRDAGTALAANVSAASAAISRASDENVNLAAPESSMEVEETPLGDQGAQPIQVNHNDADDEDDDRDYLDPIEPGHVSSDDDFDEADINLEIDDVESVVVGHTDPAANAPNADHTGPTVNASHLGHTDPSTSVTSAQQASVTDEDIAIANEIRELELAQPRAYDKVKLQQLRAVRDKSFVEDVEPSAVKRPKLDMEQLALEKSRDIVRLDPYGGKSQRALDKFLRQVNKVFRQRLMAYKSEENKCNCAGNLLTDRPTLEWDTTD